MEANRNEDTIVLGEAKKTKTTEHLNHPEIYKKLEASA